jgi:hypothetical protein
MHRRQSDSDSDAVTLWSLTCLLVCSGCAFSVQMRRFSCGCNELPGVLAPRPTSAGAALTASSAPLLRYISVCRPRTCKPLSHVTRYHYAYLADESRAFKDILISRSACKCLCCSGLKRDSLGKPAAAKTTGQRMRNTPSLLRELPPGSICGRSTSVPRSLPIGQFLRMFNGCDAAADAGCGLLFSIAAHLPFTDELPSAWTGLQRCEYVQLRYVR